MDELQRIEAGIRAAEAQGDMQTVAALAKEYRRLKTGPAPGGPGTPAAATGGPGSPPAGGVAAPIAGGPATAAPARSLAELTPGISVNPTDGMTNLQRGLAGAGQATDSTIRGVRQVFNYLTGDEEEYNQLKEAENEARERDAALLATGAGRTGQIAGHIAQAAIPGLGLAKGAKALGGGTKALIAGESALGGAMGALQPVAGDEKRSTNAAWGATIGAAIPFGGAVLSKVRQLPATTIDMALRALTPYGTRQAGSVLAKSMKLGSPKVRREAGRQIAEITKDVRVPVSQDLAKALRKVATRYDKSLKDTDALRDIKGIAALGLKSKGAKLKGAELSEFLTALGREAAINGGFKKSGLQKAHRVLNDALISSMSKAQAKQLLAAREMYKTGTRPPKLTLPGLGASSTRGTVQGLRTGDMPAYEQQEQE